MYKKQPKTLNYKIPQIACSYKNTSHMHMLKSNFLCRTHTYTAVNAFHKNYLELFQSKPLSCDALKCDHAYTVKIDWYAKHWAKLFTKQQAVLVDLKKFVQ